MAHPASPILSNRRETDDRASSFPSVSFFTTTRLGHFQSGLAEPPTFPAIPGKAKTHAPRCIIASAMFVETFPNPVWCDGDSSPLLFLLNAPFTSLPSVCYPHIEKSANVAI
eukprot:11866895-Ditylum_brightwellii.AAC.1